MRFFIFAFLLLISTQVNAQVSFSTGGAGGGAIKPGWATDTCNGTTAGAIRFNSQTNIHQACNGTAWGPLATVPMGAGPTMSSGSGYFVLTGTTWDGNLGGSTGADAKCFTELSSTYTSWRGYSTANSRGQIVANKISALLCQDNWAGCTGLIPLTTYYFARANSSTAGGAAFTTDAYSRGPNDFNNWAAANYFSGSYNYWTGIAPVGGTDSLWSTVGYQACANWTENANFYHGNYGVSGNTNYTRFTNDYGTCNDSRHLICVVNP